MSRSLGRVQRRVLIVLSEHPGEEGLSVTKLKRLAGGDRSNLRRAVRSLLRWELVEEATAGGERHVRLTFWGVLMVMLSLKPEEPMIVTQGKQAGEDR